MNASNRWDQLFSGRVEGLLSAGCSLDRVPMLTQSLQKVIIYPPPPHPYSFDSKENVANRINSLKGLPYIHSRRSSLLGSLAPFSNPRGPDLTRVRHLDLNLHECVNLFVFIFSGCCLRCYHCDYGTVSQCHPRSGNKSTVIKCTPTNDRCYERKISKIDSEDQLDQSCTNEDGCSIRKKACVESGDCTVTCCEEDLCNNGASSFSHKACALTSLVIVAHVGFRLLV